MTYAIIILTAIIGYLIGSINFAVVIGRLFYKKDVRKEGSKNAGATNVLRILGAPAAIAVLAGDMIKGVAAYLIGLWIGGIYECAQICALLTGFSAVVGHNYPAYFRFKGGKGILTSLALSFMIDWRAALMTLAFAVLVIILTRYVSAGSILGCMFNATILPLFTPFDYYKIICVILLAIFAAVRHKGNILRIIKGEENKIGVKRM